MAQKNKNSGSLAEDLRGFKAKRQSKRGTGSTFDDAVEGIKEASVVFDAIHDGTHAGISHEKMILGKGSGEAAGRWLSMTWEEWEAEIRFLASLKSGVSEDARDVLAVIKRAKKNPLFFRAIQTVFQEVMRPARLIWHEEELDNFLFLLTNQGLLAKMEKKPGTFRKAEWKGSWYCPASGVLKAQLVWEHVFKVTRRVQRREEQEEQLAPRIKPLLEKATLGSDLEDKSLSRLIRNDTLGSTVIWTLHSAVGKDQEDMGFLALLLGRFDKGVSSLILSDWEADRALPPSMGKGQDYELPNLIVSEAPGSGLLTTWFGQLSGFPKEEHVTLLRIQRLIRWWVGREGALPRMRELPPAVSTAEQETQ